MFQEDRTHGTFPRFQSPEDGIDAVTRRQILERSYLPERLTGEDALQQRHALPEGRHHAFACNRAHRFFGALALETGTALQHPCLLHEAFNHAFRSRGKIATPPLKRNLMSERTPLAANWPEIHRLMGEASQAFAKGELQRAAEGAAEALKLAPDMPEALHLMGLCLLQSGDARRAASLMREAALRKPGEAQLLHNLGIACVESGDVSGGLSAFTRAVMLDPKHAESRFNMGVLSEGIGDSAGAEQAYRDTLALAPKHTGAAAYLAVLLEQKSALEEAARWNDVALTSAPQEPVANLTAAQLDLRGGKAKEAAQRLESLLSRGGLAPRKRAQAAGRVGYKN